MVLGETVVFFCREDASAFSLFLKTRKCPSRIRMRGEVTPEEVVTGTLDQIIALFGRQEERWKENGEGETRDWFRKRREKFEEVRSEMERLLSGRVPGELLYRHADLEASEKEIRACLRDPTANRKPGGYPLSDAHGFLRENGVVRESPEGFTLEREVRPGDIRFELSLEGMPAPDPRDLQGFDRAVQYYLDILYILTIDPVIHFRCDPVEMIHMLGEMDVDDDHLAIFQMNLDGKKRCITALVDELKRAGPLTIDELERRLGNGVLQSGGKRVQIFGDPGGIAALVLALKNLHILTGTGAQVRLAGGTSR
jgi:hypothetical protein